MKTQNASHTLSDVSVPIQCASESDATEVLLGLDLKEGHNHIARNAAGLELLVRAKPQRQIEYVILDATGKPIEEQIYIRVVNQKEKETTCWACGVDAEGNRHCWKVTCPDIVGPWDIGKVATKATRFLSF